MEVLSLPIYVKSVEIYRHNEEAGFFDEGRADIVVATPKTGAQFVADG
jgi:hypothetical protein